MEIPPPAVPVPHHPHDDKAILCICPAFPIAQPGSVAPLFCHWDGVFSTPSHQVVADSSKVSPEPSLLTPQCHGHGRYPSPKYLGDTLPDRWNSCRLKCHMKRMHLNLVKCKTNKSFQVRKRSYFSEEKGVWCVLNALTSFRNTCASQGFLWHIWILEAPFKMHHYSVSHSRKHKL